MDETVTPKQTPMTTDTTTQTAVAKPSLTQKLTDFSKANRKALMWLGVVLVGICIIAILVLRGIIVVALVNGEPVYRHQVLQALETNYGKDTSDTIIIETIIRQELDKKGITISQEELDQEMAEINNLLAAQGQTLEDYLSFQGLSEESFRNNVVLNLRIRKALAQEIQVTDEEIATYITENSDQFDEGVDTTTEEFRGSIREQLFNEKVNERASIWVEELRKSASIKYFKSY